MVEVLRGALVDRVGVGAGGDRDHVPVAVVDREHDAVAEAVDEPAITRPARYAGLHQVLLAVPGAAQVLDQPGPACWGQTVLGGPEPTAGEIVGSPVPRPGGLLLPPRPRRPRRALPRSGAAC